MTDGTEPYRRTVLKTLAAGVVGGTTLVGTVDAGSVGDERRQDTFAWGRGVLYEMLESEPHPPTSDDEGDEESHRPLWIIDSMAGTGVAGSEHSPHPAPVPGIDHVVPLDGPSFTAQWHVHVVTDGPFDPNDLSNVTNTDGNGNYLTSAAAINAAAANGDITVTPLVHPETGEPDVFTCPIRPHNHR